LSRQNQQAVVQSGGGSEKAAVPALDVEIVTVPAGQANQSVAGYKANRNVKRVEVSATRKAASVPSDPAYGSQWALPKIGWDQVYGSVNPAGSATIAVLDTGVDGSQPDLAGRLVAGWSAFANSNPAADPNGHGTALAGIAAAVTNNGNGIAGVDYAGASVMPVQVLGADGTGQDADIITGVTCAADP